MKSDSFEHRKQTRESSLYPDIGTRSVGIRGMEGHSTPETRTTTKGGKLHRQSSGQTYPGSKYWIQLSSTDFARETSAARSDERKSDQEEIFKYQIQDQRKGIHDYI